MMSWWWNCTEFAFWSHIHADFWTIHTDAHTITLTDARRGTISAHTHCPTSSSWWTYLTNSVAWGRLNVFYRRRVFKVEYYTLKSHWLLCYSSGMWRRSHCPNKLLLLYVNKLHKRRSHTHTQQDHYIVKYTRTVLLITSRASNHENGRLKKCKYKIRARLFT